MAQFLRPNADVVNPANWYSWQTDGTLYDEVDEVTRSDSDYIYSQANQTGFCVIGLSSVYDPYLSTGHVLRYALRRTATNKNLTFVVSLLQDANTAQEAVIASWTHANPANTFTPFAQTLSASQADAITNYGTLSIKFDVTVNGGGGIQGQISWAEFEVPDAGPVTEGTFAKTLDSLVLSAGATVEYAPITGTSAKTLDDLGASSGGTVETAVIAGYGVLSWLEFVIPGSAVDQALGTLSQTLEELTFDSAGTVENGPAYGSLQEALDELTSDLAGTVAVTGQFSRDLDNLTAGADGDVTVTGTSAQSLDDLAGASAGKVDVEGAFAQTLSDITALSSGSIGDPPIDGALQKSLDALTAAGSGTVAVAGSVSTSLDNITIASTGQLPVSGTAGVSLDGLTADAAGSVGTVTISGTSQSTLSGITFVSTGKVATPTVGTLILSEAMINARLDAIQAAIGTSPVLKIFSGSSPASIEDSASGTLLATISLPEVWMTSAVSGSKFKAGIWQTLSASNTGTAGYFRIYASDGVTAHLQGDITATGGGGDLELDTLTINTGEVVSVLGFELYESLPTVESPEGTGDWSENLILNNNFDLPGDALDVDNFQYWVHIFPDSPRGFYTRYKPADPSPQHTTMQFDHDDSQSYSMNYGDEDWLYQDMTPGVAHTEVLFQTTEIQHDIDQSVLIITIYGSNDGNNWTPVWSREGCPIPDATTGTDHVTSQYIFSASYAHYRLEYYGHYLSVNGDTGYKTCLLELRVR